MSHQALTRLRAGSERDLVARPLAVAVWTIGVVVIALGFVFESLRAVAWTTGFGMSGALCLVNAVRSKRFHCAFTGPIFLVGAALTVATTMGRRAVSLPVIGWGVVASVLAAVIYEVVSGKRRIGGCC